MIQKAKVAKAFISVITLFAFVHWGLDPDSICQAVGDASQTCGYSGKNDDASLVGPVFAPMLTVLASAMLWAWVRKG